MKKIALVSFLLVLLVSSCASVKQFRYMSKGKAPKGSFRTEIPFELHNGLIVIKAKLNGSDKEMEFMVDSGAPVSVIYQEAMEESKAKKVMTYRVSDSQGNSAESDYVMMDVKIGNLQFKDIFTAYSAQTSEVITCIASGGIIGADLMQTANWHIDFENKKIVLSDRKKSSLPDLKDYQKVPFSKRAPMSKIPWITIVPGMTVDLKVNGELFKDVYVDLGSSGALTLSKREVTNTLFKNDSAQVLIGYSSFGLLGGQMDTTYYYKSSNTFMDDINFKSHSIDVSRKNRFLLGTTILSEYTLFIDFRKKDFYLKPRVPVEDTLNKKKFGCNLAYNSKTKTCFVGNLFEGSGADLSGIQLNDTVVEINGEKLPVFNDYCEFKDWHTKLHERDLLMIKISRKEEVITLEKALVPRRR